MFLTIFDGIQSGKISGKLSGKRSGTQSYGQSSDAKRVAKSERAGAIAGRNSTGRVRTRPPDLAGLT